MKKEYLFVAGIDISKRTFDITLSKNEFDGVLEYKCFANNPTGVKQLIKWLRTLDINIIDVLFCMENTGIYHRFLASSLIAKDAFVWVETATQIKWSMGIQRGKNDKVDSQRIMEYAKRNIDKARSFIERSKNLQQISDLLAVRKRLMDCRRSLKVPVKELKAAHLKDQAALLEKATRKTIKSIAKELDQIEDTIKNLIRDDEKLREIFAYVTSVKSVGFVAACQLMVYTDCFTKFKSAKQIASYAGIAPFGYSSGTSIKGRTRVHHMANKNLKTVLHMCAISSLASNDEMKKYFERKVGEGKNKMLVINSIRNKLLSRVFSCVKNKKMYVPNLAA